MNPILLFVLWYIAFTVSTVLHEAGHALTARLGGDNTASSQVTLDPRPHIKRSPVGMIVMPILTYLLQHWMIGWASAPYDPEWGYSYPRRASKMALAGPLCNLSLAIWSAFLMRVGVALGWFHFGSGSMETLVVSSTGEANAATVLCSLFFMMNLILFGFNLLPIPPLDGAAVAGLFMDENTSRRWQALTFRPEYQIAAWLLSIWVFQTLVIGPLMRLAGWMLGF